MQQLKFSIFALLLAVVPAAGQAISGDVTGSVTDPSGAVIPGISLTISNDATGVKAATTSDGNGQYRFFNLSVGIYTLTATGQGFGVLTRKGLHVELSSTLTVNFSMQVSSSATTVEVTEAGAGVDTTTAQLITSFESRAVQEVPSASQGSGVWNLSLLGSGVASSGGVGQGTGPSISGQRPENNTFNLDGVSNNNYYSTGPLVIVPNDAIAELSILQNQYSPEFGGGSGGVFNAIVRSGGNQIHGSIYEYLQNRQLNAVDALAWTQGITSNPRYDHNRLGATLGGPILKNKLFYFGLFEYNPIGQAALPGSPISAPTAAGWSALAGASGVSQNNLTQLQKYIGAAPANDQKTLSVAGRTIPIGSLAFSAPSFQNNYNTLVSIDYTISSKDQLRGRVVLNKHEALDTSSTFPAFWAPLPNDNKFYSVTEFHNFSPSMQNELRLSYSRNVSAEGQPPLTFPGLDKFPVITIDELNGLTIGPSGPMGSTQNLAQGSDNFTKVFGKHTVKAGFNFTDVILTNYFISRVNGNYEYSSLEQYLLDLTPDVLGERSAGPTSYPAGSLLYAAYLNDDYRFTQHLTLNLGLRYEYATTPVASRYQAISAPASVPGGITFAEPKPGKNDWAPRLGFAYSPDAKGQWSIRGGFSRVFDATYGNLTSNSAPPYFQQTNDVDLNSSAPNFLKNGGLPGSAVPLPKDTLGARSVIGSYTFGDKRPYGLTYTLGVQHSFANNYTLEVRYAGSRGVHLWNQTRLNIAPQVNSSNYIQTFALLPGVATLATLKPLGTSTSPNTVKGTLVPGGTSDRPWDFLASQGFESNLISYAPQGYSAYNGLAIQLNRRYANGFSYIGAFTWSHLLDDSTATNFSTYLSPRRAQDFQNLRPEWSSSALDRRGRFTFTAIYDWTPFKNGNWFLKNVAGNWNAAGTYTYQSPEYATVQSNTDSNLNNDSAGDRTIINPAGTFNIGSGVTAYNALGNKVATGSASTVAYVINNPNARFVVAGPGALANSGRNNFPLRPINNFDIQFAKRLMIREGIKLQLAGQFYNVFNHAQYVGGYINDVAPNAFVGARNDLVPSDPLFGRFDQFYSSNSRTIQINAKFTF